MNAKTLLAELADHGIIAHADGDRIRLDAPAGAMTPDLLAAVKSCKDDLLELLKFPGGPGAGSDDSGVAEPAPARAISSTSVAQDHHACDSRADREFRRFEEVARPMPGGGLYCPVYGSPTMPRGADGEAWRRFEDDCGGLGRKRQSHE